MDGMSVRYYVLLMTAASIKACVLSGALALIAAAAFALHSTPAVSPKTKQAWKTGFWLWAGEPPAPSDLRPDVLYVEALGRRWPRPLPGAGEYVVVRRVEPSQALTRRAAAGIAEDFATVVSDAGGAQIVGLQIDYDCPTNKLETYGEFLKTLRDALPPGSRLSVTALLDWFRPKTRIAEVLASVDEFVPQFYDVGTSRASAGIATTIDAAQWAPIFNAYGTPYRIGVSTFGRIARRRTDPSGQDSINYFRDATPLDFAGRRELKGSASTTPSGEAVVHYDVAEPMPDKPELRPRDAVEITFPTESSVRSAVEAARAFGGYNAGIIFFRWPGRSETLTFSPEDVQRIASGKRLPSIANLEVREATCIERQCADLYLAPHAVNSSGQTIGIRTLGLMEVFLPGSRVHTFSLASEQIGVEVPAYSGFGKIYIGRVISRNSVRFEEFQP